MSATRGGVVPPTRRPSIAALEDEEAGCHLNHDRYADEKSGPPICGYVAGVYRLVRTPSPRVGPWWHIFGLSGRMVVSLGLFFLSEHPIGPIEGASGASNGDDLRCPTSVAPSQLTTTQPGGGGDHLYIECTLASVGGNGSDVHHSSLAASIYIIIKRM